MTEPTWMYENFEPAGSAIGYRITRKLDEVQSPFQKIEIYESTDWGNLMLIDGAMMLTTRDNFLYHEMMSHPALFTHAAPKRVVIIGGGDCGTLREVLKHPGVESATQCDIDEQVTRMAEKWFPELCDANNDARAELLFDDGIAYMANCPEGSVDIVIVDSTDPVGPAEGLFNKAFYASCFKALKDDGILVQQSESPLVLLDLIKEMRTEMGKAGFTTFKTLPFPQPCYPTGWWSCTLARKSGASITGRWMRARRRSRRSTTPPISTRGRWRRSRSWRRRWGSDALERVPVQFARADPDHLVQFPHEDLPVPDLARAGGLHDGLDHGIGLVVGDGDLQLDLGQEIHDVLGAAVQLGVALLPPEPLDLGGRDARHARLGQGLADVIQLEGLDDRHDHLHHVVSMSAAGSIPPVVAAVRRFPPTPARGAVRWRAGCLPSKLQILQEGAQVMSAMIDFEKLDELARRLSSLVPPSLRDSREELQENFKSVLQSGLAKLDLVTREEFEVQRAVLLRTREKLDELQRTVADLESQIDAPAPPRH